MKITLPLRETVCIAAILLSSLAAGCAMRPQAASRSDPPAEIANVSGTPAPAPTDRYYTVEFRAGDVLLSSETVKEGSLPAQVPVLRHIGSQVQCIHPFF